MSDNNFLDLNNEKKNDKVEDASVETESAHTPVDESYRKKANTYFFSKVAFNLILIIIGAIVISLFLRNIQSNAALEKQRKTSKMALNEAVTLLEENAENAEVLTQLYHDGNQDVLDDMSQLFSSGLYQSLEDAGNKTRSKVFADVVERSGVEYLFLLSREGKIVLSPEASMYGVNPAARALMTQENVNDILKGTVKKDGTVEPVVVGNQYGSYFFYSMPYKVKGEVYYLVLGADSSVLDVQIESLTDVSVVLSRAAISNNGFLFAVDHTSGTFVYYKNGDDILTGQSALKAGLSQAALEDGYSGIQTIRGVDYYCVSKKFGDRIVVCAVSETAEVLSNDKYVLFWTILGFIAVMLLCLAYAVVVRNDFVRHAVVTERVCLNKNSKNPTYFDKSVFKKVFPLMLISVFLMFGVSFYTQTLLEITQGIEKSDVALKEVSARYDESIESREIIEKYYDNRFLAKAKLISFLIEENPAVLNADSNYYHSGYDKYGDKEYMLDDEGNRLKSVSKSARLQELCDANDIKSVYIYDEDGYTIGTNTENWYFVISHDEKDQSYPFLKVLEGKVDSYVQESMKDDMGENSQYIGVVFNYYTTKDSAGNTRYVSRYEYEKALEEDPNARDGTAGGITAHRSMIQIGLDNEISEKLLDSTDVANILTTNMLDNGFIVMFDTTDDHLCVYSPNEAEIGKKASQLGISPNAFGSDDYYGFTTHNGEDYFQLFRYADGYNIATALPKSDMYQTRGKLALITALICFLLILILSGTVTLTNKEEEIMYQTMSEEQASKGLNSVIFNTILPSGRNASTVKAAARWDNRRIPWSECGPEQKLLIIVSALFGIVILYIGLAILGADRFLDNSSIVHYIIDGDWDKGWNIFALSSCAIVIISMVLLVVLFRIPVRIVSSLLGARGETIGHLLLSVVKYGGAIGTFFYCLYLLGIDSSSLLASAGILSLVIGLGAQSLIKDIIAGIFIVFEGEFRVGDIVTIGGYRGTVMDIGLRTTKILGADGNIKIYNNSEISGVLNMTQEASVAMAFINIEYGQDLEYVEAVLERELPSLKQNNPKILDGPEYLGVSELQDSGVQLLIICRCSETEIKEINRYLNKEILQIFYRNGINVPFPNVTYSPLDISGRKTIKDLKGSSRKKGK